MGAKLVLEGNLVETVTDGEVLAATVDDGATVGDGLHVRFTSVDKRREHHALGLLVGSRVRVTVELVSAEDAGDVGGVDGLSSEETHWAGLVDRVSHSRELPAGAAGVA